MTIPLASLPLDHGLLTLAAGSLSYNQTLTLAVLALVVVAMLSARVSADVAMLGGVTVLLAAGTLTPAQAFAGFSNEGVVSVAGLFIVVAALRQTGTMDRIMLPLMGTPSTTRGALARLCIPIAALSAFVNNTPLVAVMTPLVADWARRLKLNSSQLLLPLSYATILGGTVTIIGTSTNLVVQGLLFASASVSGVRPFGFFEIGKVGLPIAVVGVAYLLIFAPIALRSRRRNMDAAADVGEFTASLQVLRGGPLDGATIQSAGLRHLSGLFLVEIDRGGESIPAPGPLNKLMGGDILIFAGSVEAVIDLRRRPGLGAPVGAEIAPHGRSVVEIVLSQEFSGIGQSVRDFGFRTRLGAAVLAVSRAGARLQGRIGDIVMHAGDMMLLECDDSFLARHRNSRSIHLVGGRGATSLPRHNRAWIAGIILLGMIGYAATQGSMLVAAWVAAGAMIVTRCVRAREARESMDLSTLGAIAGSLGISMALQSTGLGKIMGEWFVSIGGGTEWGAMAGLFAGTVALTSCASNNAAAALMFPIALGAAASVGSSPMPFIAAVLFAANSGNFTPIGYQTNLMVYGPGGYRFIDYVKLGLPMDMLSAAIALWLIPQVWPMH